MTFTKKIRPVIRRLSEEELLPVFSAVWEKWPYKDGLLEKINVPYLANSWAGLMKSGTAVAFATFKGGEAKGVLLGLIAPDLHTGELKGIEYLWTGKDTVHMLEHFETLCKERGCKSVVCGAFVSVLGDRAPALRRLYRQRNYLPLTEAFLKRL